MGIKHNIMISKQHTTQIQSWFSLKQAITHESSKKRIHHQTSKQHIFGNIQSFLKPRPLLSSASRDLLKACIHLSNGDTRKLTKIDGQL